MAKNRFNIAVIAGDGIGKEVVPEGLRVLETVASKFGINLHFDHFDFSSYDYYAKHGDMLPEDWKEQIGSHDAIFFGAVGLPDKIPDHVSLWGSLLKFRREFDQYVNLRPVRLLPGVPSPLANRAPGDIDFYIVRENTEGEYSSIGGRMFADTEREVEGEGAGRDRLDGHRALLAHPHDGALAELFVDLGEGHVECLVAVVAHIGCLLCCSAGLGPCLVPTGGSVSANL